MSTTSMSAVAVRAGTYDVDPVHSRIAFAVKHLGINLVRGSFTRFEGTLEIPEDLRDAKVTGVIQAGSIDTGFAMRDEHLRTADFLDVENTPFISFASKSARPLVQEHVQLAGDITIRGVTRPITLDVEISGDAIDQYGNDRLGLQATGRLDRNDFGMPFNQAPGGIMLVANRIDLLLDVEAIRRP